MLLNIFLANLETGKDKNEKNATLDFCHSSNLSLAHFCQRNFFDRNLSKIDNTIDKIFSNDKDKKSLYLHQ